MVRTKTRAWSVHPSAIAALRPHLGLARFTFLRPKSKQSEIRRLLDLSSSRAQTFLVFEPRLAPQFHEQLSVSPIILVYVKIDTIRFGKIRFASSKLVRNPMFRKRCIYVERSYKVCFCFPKTRTNFVLLK